MSALKHIIKLVAKKLAKKKVSKPLIKKEVKAKTKIANKQGNKLFHTKGKQLSDEIGKKAEDSVKRKVGKELNVDKTKHRRSSKFSQADYLKEKERSLKHHKGKKNPYPELVKATSRRNKTYQAVPNLPDRKMSRTDWQEYKRERQKRLSDKERKFYEKNKRKK